DAQDELAAVAARQQPVEQGRAHPADVQVPGGAGSETGADAGHEPRRLGATGRPDDRPVSGHAARPARSRSSVQVVYDAPAPPSAAASVVSGAASPPAGGRPSTRVTMMPS